MATLVRDAAPSSRPRSNARIGASPRGFLMMVWSLERSRSRCIVLHRDVRPHRHPLPVGAVGYPLAADDEVQGRPISEQLELSLLRVGRVAPYAVGVEPLGHA